MAVPARIALASLVVVLSGCFGQAAQGRLFGERGPLSAAPTESHGGEVDDHTELAQGARKSPPPPPQRVQVDRIRLPSGRDIAALSPEDCMDMLDRAAVSFEPVSEDDAPHVTTPVYVHSSLAGVSFGPTNGDTRHGMLDCRLAVALYAWAPILAEAGVTKVEHYSTYRPGARVRGKGKSSGHAFALAIDAARFHMDDGRVLDVDVDWDDRERRGAPCPTRDDESEGGKVLRKVVCEAVERDLFQVVLTPHYDKAHQNHVHLELVPNVDWSFIH